MPRPRDDKPLLRYFGDDPVDPVRSRTMSKIRGRNTKPEIVLRRALWHEGLRFRVHDKSLPGTPDISNKSRKVAIFVDGCFWHGCPEHFRLPKTRTEFWREKIRRNRAKRQNVLREYPRDWEILQFYECKVNEDSQEIINQISALW